MRGDEYFQRLNERRYSVRSICWLGFPIGRKGKEMHPDKKFIKCDKCRNRALRRTAYCILHCKDFSKYEPCKPNRGG